MQKLGKVLDGVVRSSVEAANNEGGQAEQVDHQEVELKVDNSNEQRPEKNGSNGPPPPEKPVLTELSQLNKLINSKL